MIVEYTKRGQEVPTNGTLDALNLDHVNVLCLSDLETLVTPHDWTTALTRLYQVVCVTARENHRLSGFERRGSKGEQKYMDAGIVLVPQ